MKEYIALTDNLCLFVVFALSSNSVDKGTTTVIYEDDVTVIYGDIVSCIFQYLLYQYPTCVLV